MNQGRIWCVVNPTVGLPLFLGGVATIALLVHASVLSNTTWMADYWQGKAKAKTAENAVAAPALAMMQQATPGFAITVAPVPGTPGTSETAFVVTVSPTSSAQAAVDEAPGDAKASTLAHARQAAN